jgi:hypothetical protein
MAREISDARIINSALGSISKSLKNNGAEIYLDPKDVKRLVGELKILDKNLVKQLRADLKTDMKGIASDVRKNTPKEIGKKRLRGFQNAGPTRMARTTRATTTLTTQAKKLRNKGWTSIMAIEIAPSPKDARGIYIAELAGSRTNGVTGAGRNLVAQLNALKPMQGRGGRFFYDRFRRLRPQAIAVAENVLRKFIKKVQRSF